MAGYESVLFHVLTFSCNNSDSSSSNNNSKGGATTSKNSVGSGGV